MTHVTVLPRVRFPAWDGAEPCTVPLAQVTPIIDALEADYPGDACLVMYAPPTGDQFVRLTKAALGYFELGVDPMPLLHVILVDVDHGDDHTAPPDGWAESIVAKSPWPCGWYRTPHGLRLLYTPAELVEICYADDYLARLHAKLLAADIPADGGTRDWTRLFFTPKAMGRDLPSDYSALAEPIDWHPEDLVAAEPGTIGPIVDRDFETVLDAVPDKITRKDLEPLGKSRLADTLYRGRLVAAEGNRHAMLLSAAREIAAAFDTDDPMVVFHLLHASAVSMKKPIDELWRMCQWACAHAAGILIERDRRTKAAATEMTDAVECSPAETRSLLIIDAGQEQFVWDEGRTEYSTGYTHSHQLLGALARHCPDLAYGYYSGKVAPAMIMRDLSTVAEKVVYTYADEPRGYDKVTYTFYRRVCREDKSLRPEYDEDIAVWLAALFGEELDRGLDWLASVPLINEPTCALYVHGPKSIGKGMLASGLARIWSRECTVTEYSELIGAFNPTLKRSPIIVADERIPQDAFQSNDSSVFRRIIGNGVHRLRDLHRTPATLVGYPRVLITANNEDALVIREELSTEDLDAIRIRIGYIRTDAAAVVALRGVADRGGFASTKEATESWVAGGGIAKHVLWLAANRPLVRGDRFLVEGWESDLTRSLATAAGSTGTVAEVIALLIAEFPDMPTGGGVRWYGGKIFVNNARLGTLWKSIVRIDSERSPRTTNRLRALKALASDNKTRLDSQDGYGGRKQLSYWVIDAEVIARLADERNICPASVILEAAARESEPAQPEATLDFNVSQTKGAKR